MKTKIGIRLLPAILVCAIAVCAAPAHGMGADYPKGEIANNPYWPKGMLNLVNSTNRIGGLWVNGADTFFFVGSTTDFHAFLDEYAKLPTIEKPRLILHEGSGEAFSLGGGNRRPCDWRLDGGARVWKSLHPDGVTRTAKDTNYVLEAHFWTGGKIPFDQASIPKNVEVVKAAAEPGK